MRIKAIELPRFAIRAPTEIARLGLTQICVGECLEAARAVEPSGHLKSHAFVLHETVIASRANGLLVKAHGIGVSPFEPGNLGRHQRVLIGESRWIVFGPLAQYFLMRR